MTGRATHFGRTLDHDEESLGSCCYQGRNADRLWTVEQEEANARRIVACVNACKGLRTEDLEMDPSVDLYQLHIARSDAAEARAEEAARLLRELAETEQNYRHWHDHAGAGDINTGGWWDKMRRRGDKARAFLQAGEKP
jgi:hypothetical protein